MRRPQLFCIYRTTGVTTQISSIMSKVAAVPEGMTNPAFSTSPSTAELGSVMGTQGSAVVTGQLITVSSKVPLDFSGGDYAGRGVGPPGDDDEYEPFSQRRVKHPTSNVDTWAHLIKGCLGTGILAMPNAFKNAGYVIGFFGTLIIGAICTYCIHMLVKCSYELCRRRRIPNMSYAMTAEEAMGTPIAGHVVCNHYFEDIGIRWYMLFILLPLIAINFIRNLKLLAPFSTAANVIMPLENNMKTPRSFGGWNGVLNKAMVIIISLYVGLGLFGYLKYGDAVEGSITLNLPIEEIPAQLVQVMLALAIYISFALQCYVAVDIAWNMYISPHIERKNYRLFAEMATRTALVLLSFTLAVAIPNLELFISLFGALCLSVLGIILPSIIESVTFETHRRGWLLVKNVCLALFGIAGLVTGTYISIKDIVETFH
ncbi:hypothetical protein B566_EDAN008703 [Ephemera danica]|nr:hypothetical protein B566_EDAN008703 [Ephemera danica]